MMVETIPVRTVGFWELGKCRGSGWSQWYIRHVRSERIGLVDYYDADNAGLPDDLALFTAADVATMRETVWQYV